jgi:hypothetical protein
VIADLCTPVAPLPADPAEAAAYVQTADEARAAGDTRIAAVAYRKAAALGDAHAKAALAELCRADSAPGDEVTLEQAIRMVLAGDLEAARPALETIVAHGTAAAAGAHFFLGVIAIRRHDGSLAEAHLLAAARDPAYAAAAEAMLRLARRTGRLEAILFAGGELDTNPELLPDTPPIGATGSPHTDENGQLALTVAARPARWLALRDALVWRKQRELTSLDFLGNDAQAAVELDDSRDHVAIRYDLDYDVLAGDPYLTSHRGTLAYRRDLCGWSVDAAYTARGREYHRATEADFSGGVHMLEAGAIVHATPTLDVDARALGWREITRDPLFSNWTGGARVAVRVRPRSRLRVDATASGWYASYDAPEPDATLRRDVHLEGGGELEIDLSDNLIGIAAVTGAVNESTVEDFDYYKLVARIGLALAIGGP